MKTQGFYSLSYGYGNPGDLVWRKGYENRFIKYVNGWKLGLSGQNGLNFFEGKYF